MKLQFRIHAEDERTADEYTSVLLKGLHEHGKLVSSKITKRISSNKRIEVYVTATVKDGQ